jgi:uncharacterized Zn finger protein
MSPMSPTSRADTGGARGFPAFPPQRRGARFARSWWGNAWVKAMVDTSLDQGRLSRGRTYAKAGRVGPITVSPGRIAAPVHGTDEEPYRTVVFVEQLTDREWERFLDQVAAKAGHIAALLDKDMPHDLVEAAEDADVHLLPGVGDLDPECDCPDWGHPCKHAAALCYQASWLLDEDPFVLLLMRGRGERELLDELQRRNVRLTRTEAPAGQVAAVHTAGTAAEEAYGREVPALPDPPPPVDAPGPPLEVAAAPGLAPDALRLLAADAALRAREALAAIAATGGDMPVLDEWEDTVRWAAVHRDEAGLLERLRQPGLDRAAQAWAQGGLAGLDTLEAAWSPPKQDLARARTVLAMAWEGDDLPEIDHWRNRWTVHGRGLQLRYGQDGRWYPYEERSGPGAVSGGDWRPAGPPERDPAVALAELLL